MKCLGCLRPLAVGLALPLSAATVMTGPNDYRVEVAADTAMTGEAALVLPETGGKTTFYPGVFNSGKIGEWATVWRNVRLEDVESFSAQMRAFYPGSNASVTYDCKWQDTSVYQERTVSDNGENVLEMQFQEVSGDPLYCFVVRFRQNGADVQAKLQRTLYCYQNDKQYPGADMSGIGANNLSAPGDFPAYSELVALNGGKAFVNASFRGLGNLRCTLKGDVASAPTQIVFANTSTEAVPEETVFCPCALMRHEPVLVARSRLLSDLEAVSGQMVLSSYNINGGRKFTVQGYTKTQVDANTVRFNFNYDMGGTGQGHRFSANVHFTQVGCDIHAELIWFGHSYDYKWNDEWKDMNTPIGFGAVGAELNPVIDFDSTEKGLAIGDFTMRFTPTQRLVADYTGLLSTNWVKIASSLQLGGDNATVTPLSALLGGKSIGSKWHPALAYFPSTYAKTGDRIYQFQILLGTNIRTVGVLFKDEYPDLYARVESVTWQWIYDSAVVTLPYNKLGWYQSACVDAVDAEGVYLDGTTWKTAPNGLAISGLTYTAPAKKRVTLSVDGGFAPGDTAMRLEDVTLNVAPAAGEVVTIGGDINGYGEFKVAGAGTVRLAADVRQAVEVELSSGVCEIVDDVTFKNRATLKTGATLACTLSSTRRPVLTVGGLTVEEGAKLKVVVTERLKDVGDEGKRIRLTSGALLTSGVLDRLTLDENSLACGGYKGTLSVVDGDLHLTLVPKKGLVVIVR